jgi:uncharacterized membrane protein
MASRRPASKTAAGRTQPGKAGAAKTASGNAAASRAASTRAANGRAANGRAANARAASSGAAAGQPASGQRGGRGPAASVPASKPPAGLPDAPSWLRWSTLILSVLGLAVSIYLTVEHYTTNTLAGCSENGAINCTKVTTSAQSVVFGIFPVAVLGLAFFVLMVAANSPWAWNWKLPAFRWLRLASVVVGIGFVLYLVYAELFQIQAICLYCTSVHIITFLLFAIIVFDSTFRHAPRPAPAAPLQRR